MACRVGINSIEHVRHSQRERGDNCVEEGPVRPLEPVRAKHASDWRFKGTKTGVLENFSGFEQGLFSHDASSSHVTLFSCPIRHYPMPTDKLCIRIAHVFNGHLIREKIGRFFWVRLRFNVSSPYVTSIPSVTACEPCMLPLLLSLRQASYCSSTQQLTEVQRCSRQAYPTRTAMFRPNSPNMNVRRYWRDETYEAPPCAHKAPGNRDDRVHGCGRVWLWYYLGSVSLGTRSISLGQLRQCLNGPRAKNGRADDAYVESSLPAGAITTKSAFC